MLDGFIQRALQRLDDLKAVGQLYRDMKTHTFSDMPVGWEYSFIYSARHFIDAYFKGQPPSLTGEQGREILCFAPAAQESARVGAAVRL